MILSGKGFHLWTYLQITPFKSLHQRLWSGFTGTEAITILEDKMIIVVPFFFRRISLPITNVSTSKYAVVVNGSKNIRVLCEGTVVSQIYRECMMKNEWRLPIEKSTVIRFPLQDTQSVNIPSEVGSVKTIFFVIKNKVTGEYRELTKDITIGYLSTTRTRASPYYFSTLSPHFQPHGVVPKQKGLYMFSYARDFTSIQPTGSTNYKAFKNNALIKFDDEMSEHDELVLFITSLAYLHKPAGNFWMVMISDADGEFTRG